MITLYRCLAPLLALLLPLIAPFNAKLRRGLKMRLRPRTPPTFAEAPLWIHAASGEFEYAKAVIRELKSRRPTLPIVVTYFSPTYANNVESFPGVDHAEPLPLDLPGPTRGFLKRLRPRACVIARTDFWPELLTQARRLGIPRLVFAYTQRPGGGLKNYVTRLRLNLIDEILTVSDADQRAVRELLPNARVDAVGDPRFDQVAFRLDHPRALPASLRPTGPTLVAGSTWEADEAVLLPAVADLVRTGRLKLILVPHEPTAAHVAQLEAKLEKLNLKSKRYSEGVPFDSVLIVDQTGILAELYAWGEFAYVGGSFGRGVHSVMEALGTGAFTFVGPRHLNNREATEYAALRFEDRPGLNVIRTAEELREALTAWLDVPERPRVADALRAEFQNRRGAAAVIAARLLDLASPRA